MDLLVAPLTASLQDRYRIERELGRGGMATVYLSHDLRHDRPVALKVLRPELSSVLGRERFLREIEIAARLQHPNILPLFDSGSAGEFLYYTMPYVEGESLRDLLEREKQLPVDQALAIAREIGDALAYAHGHGVVHRDIKPGNIMVARGHALVADFGIARAIRTAGNADDLTASGLAIGTPAYMSPEQSTGQDGVDGRSDLYSLGCVLYEMLAGQPPFSGRTAQAIAARHLQDPPPALRVVRPSVPAGVQHAIETALAKVPADRFQTAERFVAALDKPERREEGSRRGTWAPGVAVAAALLVGGALWRFGAPRSAALDPNKVVVFPLVEVPAGAAQAGTGEAIAVLIESALEHSDPLRWIDGWQQLQPEQRSNPSLVTSAAARGIARDRGALWYTTGAVVHGGDSTTIVLRLNDARGDSIVSQATASGPSDRAPQAGLQAVNELLIPIVAPGRKIDLTALIDRKPGAVADWLQGEREYRRGNFDSSLVHLRRAVGEDSLLVVAALRAAQAASWKSLLPEADDFARVALARVELLPDRQAKFARGLVDYLDGKADSAVYWLTRALERTPDWPEAHMALGEVYQHLLPMAAAPLDSLARAEFTLAAADTGFTPPHFHLAELAIRRGDLAGAGSVVHRFDRSGARTEESAELAIMLACARGEKDVDWPAWARTSPMVLLSAAKLLSVAATFPRCTEAASHALLAEPAAQELRRGVIFLLQNLWAAEGRDSAIIALTASPTGPARWQEAIATYLVDVLAGAPQFDPRVRAAVAGLRKNLGARYEDSLDSGTRLLLGTWYARSGQVADAARLQGRLSQQASSTGRPDVKLCAAALAGHILLARGDSVAALSTFERLTPVARRDFLVWGATESLPVERLVLAELLVARRRYRDAIAVAGEFDHPTPIVYLAFLPASLTLRYHAAWGLGQFERAGRYRDRLAALRPGELLAASH
jgi:tetratricopeptide (TPR) repeat protein